jgi:hypothetical protein
MSARAAAWIAWSAWASTVPATALTLLLASLNVPSSSPRNTAFISLVVFAFSSVGALVAPRRPTEAPEVGVVAVSLTPRQPAAPTKRTLEGSRGSWPAPWSPCS